MAKRNFQFKLLAYLDAVETNNPEDVILNTKEVLADDLGGEQVCRIDSIPASTTDDEIEMGFNDAKFIFIKNLGTLPIDVKLNNVANTAFTIGAGKVFYLESVSSADVGLITNVYVTNSDPSSSVTVQLFASN